MASERIVDRPDSVFDLRIHRALNLTPTPLHILSALNSEVGVNYKNEVLRLGVFFRSCRCTWDCV